MDINASSSVPWGAVENMMGLCICVNAHSKYATKAWQ